MSTAHDSMTGGYAPKWGSRAFRSGVELLSSMRFSISLLTIICIASVIGTVLQQAQSTTAYINKFGPFWTEVFLKLSLNTVYSAWWFLLILAFLVLSTTLCLVRNTPKILGELKLFKEGLKESSLRAFGHKAEAHTAEPRAVALERARSLLSSRGYRFKLDPREGAVLIAGKAGAANKLGYIAAHSAIVLVCIGGLLDGDMIVRAAMKWQGTSPARQNMAVREVPQAHRLSVNTPAFRGNVFIPEKAQANYALLNFDEGVVVQDLPFTIALEKFVVEYYSTGMPKLFASDVKVTRANGEVVSSRIEVNKPLIVDGIAIYQSSFDDGGSALTLRGYPLGSAAKPFEVKGEVGTSTRLTSGDKALTLEFTSLRTINVENMAGNPASGGTDVRRVDLGERFSQHLGSGAKLKTQKTLQNVGPSVNYILRDQAGQGKEFHSYQLPVTLDGQRVHLIGVRESPNDAFRYMRIPTDEKDEMDGFMRFRAALADGGTRARAVERFARAASAGKTDASMKEQLAFSASRALDLFAGVLPAKTGATPTGGLQALADFMEATVPEAARANASEVLLKLLNGVLYQLYEVSREDAGLAAPAQDEKTAAFLTQSLLAMSDSFNFGAPLVFQLTDFKHVQASVFQVAKAPGKSLVYLGCLLLIVGVFAMLYVRERRLWLLLKDSDTGGTSWLLAMSTTRKTVEFEREFEALKALLQQSASAKT